MYETKECEEEATILKEEVRKALEALSNEKSPGSDGIPIELLNEVNKETIKVLSALCQQIWMKRIRPKQWKESNLYQYHKRRCQNMLKQSDNTHYIA